jgi:hypothetical protein
MLSPSFTGTIIIRFLSPPFFRTAKVEIIFQKKDFVRKILCFIGFFQEIDDGLPRQKQWRRQAS